MKDFVLVSLRDDNLVCRFSSDNGVLKDRVDFNLCYGPGPMTINSYGNTLFVGLRKSNQLVAINIDEEANLTEISRTIIPSDPCFLCLDFSGKYLFSSYYNAGRIALHKWDLREKSLKELTRICTFNKAHSLVLDPTEHYIYVLHTEPNIIVQFRFDKLNGMLSQSAIKSYIPEAYLCPRHAIFHPTKQLLYTVNEKSNSVSVFSINISSGSLKLVETLSTLPNNTSILNMAAEIKLGKDAQYLYISNRGHNSIAYFHIDLKTGIPRLIDTVPAPKTPRSFDISKDGTMLYCAGQDDGILVTYKINQDGFPKETNREYIGRYPMWVTALSI